jgi:MSHA biogenesis protein MshI
MQWFKQQKQQAWTAIRTSGEVTTIAQVLRREGTKPLVNMALVEDGNIRETKHAQALAKKHKLKHAKCTFVLDSKDYQLLQVESPNVPEQERKEALRWKLKDMVDYPVDQATVDYMKIPQDPAYPNKQDYVYAVAAKNELIGQLCNTFSDADINLKAIDVRVATQRNIAALLEEKDRGLAVLSFGRNGGLLTFTSGGELYHTRFIEIEEDRSAGAAHERIALELQRSLDNFDRQFPFITVNKLLVAPCEEREALLQHLKSALYTQVASFELSDIFEFATGVEIDGPTAQAALLHTLGAALREEVAA